MRDVAPRDRAGTYFSFRIYDAVPWHSTVALQGTERISDLPRVSRDTRHLRYLPIGRHATARNSPNDVVNPTVAGHLWLVLRVVPHIVRTHGIGLLGADVLGVDIRVDEVFWRNRRTGKATQHGELAGVGHRIGKRALQ